jgi:acetate kinase
MRGAAGHKKDCPIKDIVMDDYALVLNAGSSSLKFCVFQRPGEENWRLDVRGQIDGIGSLPRLIVKDAVGEIIAVNKLKAGGRNGLEALDTLSAWLHDRYAGARVLGVGHRVVHGGARFLGPTLVTREVMDELYELVPLAPLHQPHNLAAIEAVFERLPQTRQVACFDTSFHRGRAAVAELIPLPREIRQAGVQRYGFHGLSYEYIASILPREAPEIAGGRVILAHLGGGASLCAVQNGKSVDASFGFTALDGLCMGTRPGSLDPGALLFLFQSMHLTPKEVETILYRESGLLGLSGVSHDMRVLLGRPESEARLAVEYFVYRAVKEIGALAAVLGGLDGLVFTAGVGENSPEIRKRICEACRWLGVELDEEANQSRGPRITTLRSKVSAWVFPTNEELVIARHTGSLLGL